MKTPTPLTVSLSVMLLFSLLPQAKAAGFSADGHQPTLTRNSRSAFTSASFSAQRAAGRLRFVKRLVKEKNQRRKYTVDASYPQLVNAKDANAAAFNRAVQQLFMSALNDFKKNAGPPDVDIPKEMQWSSFDGGYSMEYSGPRLISVSFGFGPYYAGAAHPSPFSQSLNFDLQTGRTLALSDLFKPRSQYLHVISDHAVRDLIKELGDDADREWIQKGAAPDSENYKSWNLTRNGLSVTFDPYQVAAYAYGAHTVAIPYSALRQVINPDGPLGQFVK